jgi:hypothetical protein
VSKFLLAMTAVLVSVLVPVLSMSSASAAEPEWAEVDGVRVTWDSSTFYATRGCSFLKFAWVNNSGEKLLKISTQILSTAGVPIGSPESSIGVEDGLAGVNQMQFCLGYELPPGAAVVVIQVAHFSMATSEIRGSIMVNAAPVAVKPEPAPPARPALPAPVRPATPLAPSPAVVDPPTPVETSIASPTVVAPTQASASATSDTTPFLIAVWVLGAGLFIVFVIRTLMQLADRRHIDRLGR